VEISFGYALSAGWESFREYMGLTIGAALLLFVLALPGCIPYVGMFYSILVYEAIKGGFSRFLLKGATRQQPDISDLFSGFAEWGNWIGLWGMRFVIAIVAAVPILLGLLIIIATVGLASLHSATTSHDAGQLFSALGAAGIGIMVIAVLCSIGLSIYAASRWLFAGYAIVEGYGVMDAFRRSDELTEGQRPQLIGIGILFSLLEMVGLVCLIIPGLFFMGIMAFALPALYVELSARE